MNPENMADWRLNKLVEICDAYHEFGALATLRDLFFQIYKAENREAANQAYWKWKIRIPRQKAKSIGMTEKKATPKSPSAKMSILKAHHQVTHAEKWRTFNDCNLTKSAFVYKIKPY